MSPLGRLAARRMGRPAEKGSVPETAFDPCSRRVLIAPVNYSGQAAEWARALEADMRDLSARSAAVDVPGGFSFPSDVVIPIGTYHNDPDWQRRQFAAATRATHVLIEAEEPPFGRMLGRSVEAQATALQDQGVSVAFMAHGSDVRLPSRHVRDNPWSHFSDAAVYAPRFEQLAARNIALLQRFGAPVFVSTPDLLLDLPEASWCPVVVDPRRWRADGAREETGPLRVAHAPSVAAVKGTEFIIPVLERLEAEGVIVADLVRGVPSARMPAVFAAADVVIDQLRIGSYGVAACEAMSAGAVVVGHVSARVRQLLVEETGLELPIVEANPKTLERVLRELAEHRDLAELREAGIEFVNKVHNGRFSAGVLRRRWIEAEVNRAPDR